MSVDGNSFELPATDNVNVANFMGTIKTRGGVGTEHWYLVYDAILWAVRVEYHAEVASPVEGMVRQ